MTVCRFWERGNCRNGGTFDRFRLDHQCAYKEILDSCRFEHPKAQQRGDNPFSGGEPRGQPRNPFSSGRDNQSRGGRGGDSYRPEPQRFNNDRGRNDDRGRGECENMRVLKTISLCLSLEFESITNRVLDVGAHNGYQH